MLLFFRMLYSKTEEHLTVSGFFYTKMTNEVKKRIFRAGEPFWNSFYQRDRQISGVVSRMC